MARPKKEKEVSFIPTAFSVPVPVPDPAIEALKIEIEALKAKDAKKDEELKMLKAVADVGRVFNYENAQTAGQKRQMRVRLSKWDGKIIIGWRTIKDEIVKHPTTGLAVGEIQEYEITLLDSDSNISKVSVNGYPAFSEARYTERIEVLVVKKEEDAEGKFTYHVELPDGRVIPLGERFVN